jgi:hypothetical protein
LLKLQALIAYILLRKEISIMSDIAVKMQNAQNKVNYEKKEQKVSLWKRFAAFYREGMIVNGRAMAMRAESYPRF